jgi:hypothetical protein
MQRRALIVDDEPAVCGFIRGILSATGVEVLTRTRRGGLPTNGEIYRGAVRPADAGAGRS